MKLERLARLLNRVPAPDQRLRPLRELAEMTSVSYDSLRYAVRRGYVEASQSDKHRVWLSTVAAVEKAIAGGKLAAINHEEG